MGQRCQSKSTSRSYILTSPLGSVFTNVCDDGIHCVKLYGDTNYDKIDWDTKVDFIRASSLLPSNKQVKDVKKWLHTYFTNPLKCKDIQLSFCGLKEYGDFNSSIWMALYDTCPVGELTCYSELAIRAGRTAGASKVVGYAINKNPYLLVVGDHRCVKATGEIWTCDDSQRNKLRRLLVDYEMSHTNKTVDEALLEVKERNLKNKGSRARSTSVKKEGGRVVKKRSTKSKPKAKARRNKYDDESDSELEDEEEESD